MEIRRVFPWGELCYDSDSHPPPGRRHAMALSSKHISNERELRVTDDFINPLTIIS